MKDGYGRTIDYLRISLTDRCNFRCRYCMPPEGVTLSRHQDILSYEELLRVITILGEHGVNKIRLTGGEPLIRKGIVGFVRNIKKIGTITDLSMTTNGSLLGDMAQELKAAGLDRVNISIDTLDEGRFSDITGQGKLTEVLAGIESALAANLTPLKLNVVMTEVLSEADILYFIDKVQKLPIAVRFIEYMPVGPSGVKPGYDTLAIKEIINTVGRGMLEPTTVATGNGPAKYYRLPGAVGVVGFITAMSDHFCQSCNRMRLTADGKLKPCLLANHEIDIRTALRGGEGDQVIYELFLQALEQKPIGHRLGDHGEGADLTRAMFQVGG